MKTVFLGTTWEAKDILETLHKSKDFEIVCVITTPDKPVGRKQVLSSSAVKEYAIEHSIPVEHTYSREENYMEILEKYNPEIGVCIAFGEIIPNTFLEKLVYGCVNIHFSLLPKYRGAVPIQKAILNGEKKTGVSIISMNEKMDEGDILATFEENISEDDSNISLRERLVKKSSQVIIPTLKEWIKGEIKARTQNHKDATYCWQTDISKEKAEIKWADFAPDYIERMIRALLPWPVAWCTLSLKSPKSIAGKRIKIYEAGLENVSSKHQVGEIFTVNNKVYFSTKNSLTSLRIKTFQIEGKKIMNEKEFLNGIGRELLNIK